MMRFVKILGLAIGLAVSALFLYGLKGYFDAVSASTELASRADNLIAHNRGAGDLGAGRLNMLLQVHDPDFFHHSGVDLSTLGAGATTVTQSLSKRIAFEKFKPGIEKIRQTGFALGLEQHLSKLQILALFLDTVNLGRGPHGWMTGFFAASQALYGKSVANLDNHQFLSLVAVMIAPGKYDLRTPKKRLEKRIARIEKLLAKACKPSNHSDVWLEGCR